MPSTATDRRNGLSTSVAVKPPCKVAAIVNITLSGEQTVNGVAVTEGDRVLVTAQTSTVDNGIWVVGTATWARAKDFDGANDVVDGTLVLVGTTASASQFWLAYGNTDPILPGTSQITFEQVDSQELALRTDLADAASVTKGDALQGVRVLAIGADATTQHALNETRDVDGVTDFTVPVDGVTSATTRVAAAIAGATKRVIKWATGVISSAPITSVVQQHWRGLGWTSNQAVRPGNTFLKRSNGTQLVLSGDDASVTHMHFDGANGSGITGDGVQVAATRQKLDGVSSVNQQGVGFRIGGAGATGTFNANLWRAIHLIARSNTGDGCYVHHSGGTVTAQFPNGIPDVNVGLMLGGDFGLNGGVGLHLQNTIDNVIIATASQTNTGKGVVLESDAKSNVLIKPYSEANNGGAGNYGDEGDILAGAIANAVLFPRLTGTGSGSGWADRTTAGQNIIWGYDYQIGEFVFRSKWTLWNRLEGGGTTVDSDAWVGTNPTQVYSVKGTVVGANGGVHTVYTKIDGGALAPAYMGDQLQRLRCFAAFAQKRATLAYSASMTPTGSDASSYEITANNGTAFTINAPTNALDGQFLTFTIRNTSGGALGTATWSAFKLATWTQPADGFSRSITFRYNSSHWVEVSRTPADVPN